MRRPPRRLPYVRFPPLHRFMDGRVKPGHDVDGLAQINWKAPYPGRQAVSRTTAFS